MFVPGLIERKRDGGALGPAEWRDLLAAYADGRIPDYQMAALLMACFLRGLAREETAAGDSIKVGLKTNSVEYAGSAQAVTSSYARYAGTNYATNPQTLAAWTQAEIDALQARFEVV